MITFSYLQLKLAIISIVLNYHLTLNAKTPPNLCGMSGPDMITDNVDIYLDAIRL